MWWVVMVQCATSVIALGHDQPAVSAMNFVAALLVGIKCVSEAR